MRQQKVYLIRSGSTGVSGIDELNAALGRGWRVVAMSPLGGAASGAAAEHWHSVGCLVVVERSGSVTAALAETTEEEELLEGDGADAEIDPDL